MTKRTKIGRTTYVVNGVFKASGDGLSLSSALLRLMEKEQSNLSTKTENKFDKFSKNAGLNHEICYNGIISQSEQGCELQAKEGVLV